MTLKQKQQKALRRIQLFYVITDHKEPETEDVLRAQIHYIHDESIPWFSTVSQTA